MPVKVVGGFESFYKPAQSLETPVSMILIVVDTPGGGVGNEDI
jgi:hypothetical protein